MVDWFWRRRWGKKDYLMNKGFFAFLSVSILLLFFYVLSVAGFSDADRIYVNCPVDTPSSPFGVSGCRNPLFNSSDCGIKIPSDSKVCTTEFLAAGESLGSPEPWVLSYFWLLVFGLIVLVLGVNHFLFNKGFFNDFKEELK